MHRFHDWRLSERPDLDIGIFVGPSSDYDTETLKGVARLRERRGGKFQIVNLGGLRIRRGDELVAWIEERREAGIVGFHTSLAGYGETHDRWNGRAGDFEYQTLILRLAGQALRQAERHSKLMRCWRWLCCESGRPPENHRQSAWIRFLLASGSRSVQPIRLRKAWISAHELSSVQTPERLAHEKKRGTSVQPLNAACARQVVPTCPIAQIRLSAQAVIPTNA